jgi:hypothetical protein
MITIIFMSMVVGLMMVFSPYEEDVTIGKVIVLLGTLTLIMQTYIEGGFNRWFIWFLLIPHWLPSFGLGVLGYYLLC